MKIQAVAERGYPLQFPENTLSSFQAAIDLNFSHTKLEVHLTKDGIPVVMRDMTIDRVTSGRGEINQFTYAELLKFTINHDERIPTLAEVIHLTKGKIITAIEIKQSGFYYGLEEKVYDLIRQHQAMEDVFIISENHHSLARLRILSKQIKLGLLTDKPDTHDFFLLKELDASYYMLTFDFQAMQKLDLAVLKRMDIQPIVGTIQTIEEMKFMQNYPEVLVSTTELEKFQAICYPETIADWKKVGI